MEPGKFRKSLDLGGRYPGSSVSEHDMTINGIGILSFRDKSKYIGHINHGSIIGYGKLIRKDQSFLEGMFEKGQLNGNGVERNEPEKCTYEGNFQKGKKSGKGLLYWDAP
jgi:hypothetical protein